MMAANPPPILLLPDFIAHADALFADLRDGVQWDERMRARKTASFGVSYDYSQISYPQVPMPAVLAQICTAIEAQLGFMPNNCLLNYYPDGDSAMGFHSDSLSEMTPGTGVAIVSLGAARNIVYRAKQDRNCEFSYVLGHGSLLYMADTVQADWLHAIPKMPASDARISLSFRHLRSTG